MKQKLTYKNFISPIKYKAEDNLYHGKIEGIKEEIAFKAANVKALQKAFEEAVEDYLFFESATKGC